MGAGRTNISNVGHELKVFSTPWLQEMLGQECPEYYTKWHSGFFHWKTHKFNSTAVLIQFSIAATCNKCFQLQQFSYIIEFPLFRLTVKHRQKVTVCPGQKAKSQSGVAHIRKLEDDLNKYFIHGW